MLDTRMNIVYNGCCGGFCSMGWLSFEGCKMDYMRLVNLITETMHSIYHEGGDDKWKWMDLMNDYESFVLLIASEPIKNIVK